MASYLITNIVIFLSCFFTVAILVNAPARLKFYLYMISLTSWFVPWSALYSLFKSALTNVDIENSRLLTIEVYSLDYVLITFEYYIQKLTSLTFSDALVATALITIVGALWFLLDVVQSRRFHQSRIVNSKTIDSDVNVVYNNPKNVEIRVGDFSSPGAITGFFKPKIWIDSAITCPDKLKLVLLHELQHIQQNDHLWMWWLAAVQRIFWWNPIVQYCIRQCKLELELSCDEQCDLELPDRSYVIGLAGILINHAKTQNDHRLTLLNIKHSRKLNVQRIQRLMVSCRLKSWHRVTCMMGGLLCITSVFSIAIATPLCVSTFDQSQNYALKLTAEKNHKDNCPDNKRLLSASALTNK
ncbi:M56 family metallopeptidase [Shewanella sp. 10N.286.48.B5]|uniref:M56 family metallopeptidase n=1 Tax=Shewanella sp. 10N.286.48.B5 TaxID=1880834 RepID=UPI000C845382|nr:M56 family metallopeptidase [Shewanella sp. 10N.286.48.B5]PMH84738.1 hypothetical protein BCU57_16875 [Shewanella sp. 10N.286.48.B5]